MYVCMYVYIIYRVRRQPSQNPEACRIFEVRPADEENYVAYDAESEHQFSVGQSMWPRLTLGRDVFSPAMPVTCSPWTARA